MTRIKEISALLKYWIDSKFSNGKMFDQESMLPPTDDEHYSYAMSYFFLNKTSRSFARVIQSLHEELRHTVTIFYLVLRGLDTIEDDMTIPVEEKVKLLRSFHKLTVQEGWNYQGNGSDEKDAILLQRYEVVVKELNNLKPKYVKTIVDITMKMGNGMADFVEGKSVDSLEDYNLYTHYVAGLVGIGLTGLFQDSGLENDLSTHPKIETLSNEMGLFLQKVNILKDFLTDAQEGRLFWPKAVWSLYVSPGAGPMELAFIENKNNALACLNHLFANALELVPSCLEYLSLLKEPSVFHFAAIPQVMGIASLALFYNNYDVFQKRGVKIQRGLAVLLIQEATDMEKVKKIYSDYAAEISFRARANLGRNPQDKSFEAIAIACAEIIKWIQIHDAKKKVSIHSKSSNGISIAGICGLIFAILLMFSLFPVV